MKNERQKRQKALKQRTREYYFKVQAIEKTMSEFHAKSLQELEQHLSCLECLRKAIRRHVMKLGRSNSFDMSKYRNHDEGELAARLSLYQKELKKWLAEQKKKTEQAKSASQPKQAQKEKLRVSFAPAFDYTHKNGIPYSQKEREEYDNDIARLEKAEAEAAAEYAAKSPAQREQERKEFMARQNAMYTKPAYDREALESELFSLTGVLPGDIAGYRTLAGGFGCGHAQHFISRDYDLLWVSQLLANAKEFPEIVDNIRNDVTQVLPTGERSSKGVAACEAMTMKDYYNQIVLQEFKQLGIKEWQ